MRPSLYDVGEFLAIGYGRVMISVTAPDGKTLSREVFVPEPPKTLMVVPKTVTLKEGESFQLS